MDKVLCYSPSMDSDITSKSWIIKLADEFGTNIYYCGQSDYLGICPLSEVNFNLLGRFRRKIEPADKHRKIIQNHREPLTESCRILYVHRDDYDAAKQILISAGVIQGFTKKGLKPANAIECGQIN